LYNADASHTNDDIARVYKKLEELGKVAANLPNLDMLTNPFANTEEVSDALNKNNLGLAEGVLFLLVLFASPTFVNEFIEGEEGGKGFGIPQNAVELFDGTSKLPNKIAKMKWPIFESISKASTNTNVDAIEKAKTIVKGTHDILKEIKEADLTYTVGDLAWVYAHISNFAEEEVIERLNDDDDGGSNFFIFSHLSPVRKTAEHAQAILFFDALRKLVNDPVFKNGTSDNFLSRVPMGRFMSREEQEKLYPNEVYAELRIIADDKDDEFCLKEALQFLSKK